MVTHCLIDLIGNTPLVQLPLCKGQNHLFAKLEYFNPGGSIKDRSARFMIETAEKDGRLKKGGTIIEASSGNQGISTAMIGAAKGYKVIITASNKVSSEKIATLKAYGATVFTYPPTGFLTDPESYHTKAQEIHQQTAGSIFLNQYFNDENRQAHYHSLGPEIWRQTEGKITHFIAGAGSCGTLSGAGLYLKEKNKDIKIIGVDAANSYRTTQGNPKPYALEGLGIDYQTPLLDQSTIDTFIPVSDMHAIQMLKHLVKTFGLLVGPASGAVAYAAQEYGKQLDKNAYMVMLFGDSGRAYLSKQFYATHSSS